MLTNHLNQLNCLSISWLLLRNNIWEGEVAIKTKCFCTILKSAAIFDRTNRHEKFINHLLIDQKMPPFEMNLILILI